MAIENRLWSAADNLWDTLLMIDARGIYRKVTRKIYDFSPKQEQNILAIVSLYRGETDAYLRVVDGAPEGWSGSMFLMRYAFNYLNMRNIWLRVFASYRKLGFQEVGRPGKAIPREGAEHDLVFINILDKEFFALHPQ